MTKAIIAITMSQDAIGLARLSSSSFVGVGVRIGGFGFHSEDIFAFLHGIGEWFMTLPRSSWI
jgi:hypothetical protein